MRRDVERRDFIRLSLGGVILAALGPYLKAGKAFAAEAINKLTLTTPSGSKN